MRATSMTSRTLALLLFLVGAQAPAQTEPTPYAGPIGPPLPTPSIILPPQDGGGARPDLAGVSLVFKVVQNSTWGDGTPCQIYDITPRIRNQGDAAAGAFKVQLQRKMEAGYARGCETCTYAIPPGLAPGEARSLESRRANNCGASSNWWRILVDIEGAVYEGSAGEGNNANVEREYKMQIPAPRTQVPMRRKAIATPRSVD